MSTGGRLENLERRGVTYCRHETKSALSQAIHRFYQTARVLSGPGGLNVIGSDTLNQDAPGGKGAAEPFGHFGG
jgi:hypothetical protein